MKVLYLGDQDLIGNKFNGHDLHLYLRDNNIEASHLVLNKESGDPDTYRVRQHDSSECYTKNILHNELFTNCDLVHLHLVHNTPFDINYLPLLSQLRPVVWTIHDPWILSGHCCYHSDCEGWLHGCGDCKYLDIPLAVNHDVTALNFALKQDVIHRSNISYIVASKWMRKKLEKSPAFKHKNILTIPFGIDQEIFKPDYENNAKKDLGIDENNFVIMFRSDDNIYKGWDVILESLKHLRIEKNISILTVGHVKGKLDAFKSKFDIREFGWLKDDYELAKLYQASDVFLMPSSQEAFGMMAIEAMSCEKMVLAIPGTALEDTINAPNCGIVTKKDNFPNELRRLATNPEELKCRGRKSLVYARANYCKTIYIKRIIKYYSEAIAKHELTKSSRYVLGQLKKHQVSSSDGEAYSEIFRQQEEQKARNNILQNKYNALHADYTALLNSKAVCLSNKIKNIMSRYLKVRFNENK